LVLCSPLVSQQGLTTCPAFLWNIFCTLRINLSCLTGSHADCVYSMEHRPYMAVRNQLALVTMCCHGRIWPWFYQTGSRVNPWSGKFQIAQNRQFCYYVFKILWGVVWHIPTTCYKFKTYSCKIDSFRVIELVRI